MAPEASWSLEPGRTLRRMAHSTAMARLVDEITRATQGEHHVVELAEVVQASAEAFVAAGGAPETAARAVSQQLHLLGVTQAERGVDSAGLDRAFQRAETAALAGTRRLLAAQLGRDPLRALLHAISDYVRSLHNCAHAGLIRAGRLRELEGQQRRQALIHALFGANDPVDAFLATNDLDRTAEYVPVIGVGAALPSCLRSERALVGNLFEALVPTADLQRWLHEVPAAKPDGQVVVGSPTPLATIREGLRLTRAAAALVRTRSVEHPEPIVSCLDLLASLALSRSDVLGEMAAEKHLAPLVAMPLGRRVRYGDLLLRWLEQGRPLAHVAAEISLPAQTAHHRLTVMRDLFGDKLEDPESRLELMLALHHALPLWAEEEQASLPDRKRRASRVAKTTTRRPTEVDERRE